MTRRERLERLLEKRREWAGARAASADREWGKADLREEASGIPLGQPILVGHHSEGRHRRAIERADNAMRRAHESSEMSKRHESKAEGIEEQLDNSIFSDDADAVERLREKINRLEDERAQNNAINKIIRQNPRAKPNPEKIEKLMALGLGEATAAKLFEPDYCGGVGIPSYVNQNLGGRIKTARDRMTQITREQARTAAAEASESGVSIVGNEEWVTVTFAEKPDRAVIEALKASGFRWGHGSWHGRREDLPEAIPA